MADPNGWIIAALTADGIFRVRGLQVGSASSDYTSAEIAERSARALGLSASIRNQTDTTVAAAVWTYNHLLWYGQSLSIGQESWPAKSKDPTPDVLMYGGCVRAVAASSTTYDAVGTATLQPMIAVVQNTNGTIMSDADVAALAPGAPNYGESPAEGAARFARRLFLQSRGVAAAPDSKFVVSVAGVSGMTIAKLSKGASPEYFNRLREAASKVKAASGAAGGTYGVAALFFMQGEADYYETHLSKADYKAALLQLRNDFVADVSAGISGQSDPPVFITYQTGGAYTEDGIAIGQAQYELSLENRGWYLAAPSYAVPDKGGHLGPNDSRWLGIQMGKVWHEVVVRRRGWRPTSPLQATWRGTTVLVDFHVPSPPLQFRPVYNGQTATSYLTKGFTVTDASGLVPITEVSIAGDAVVRITCARTLVAPVTVSYGQKSVHNGNGNLCDSDPTTSADVYSYTAGSGDYAAANISELVGKPYPLWNWCVQFVMGATAN
ncbi:sialate O-acetylesterase [Methylorubrum populi]|uniref:sialate O-acetylesterase n=1 Tax=Methylorubrum populi TaxID=223967 RepID=UPI00114EF186|nr:sialate O-acetylesterase [Methylorubrum populi]QDI81679.1 sialate O-acetylesterase [Methylorubrum populi]